MSKANKANDPRLKQDKFERKDKENTSAGMIAGVIILIIGIVGIFIYYTYEVAPTMPAQTNTAPENNQNNTAPPVTNN